MGNPEPRLRADVPNGSVEQPLQRYPDPREAAAALERLAPFAGPEAVWFVDPGDRLDQENPPG